MLADPLIAHDIARILRVLTAIDFNNQPLFAADELTC
jgi:hypothetical protein